MEAQRQKIKALTQSLSEPEWLLRWREKALARSMELPRVIKRGIGMTALFPEGEPDFAETAAYHIDATKGLEIYTWKESMTQEEITPILKGLMESAFFPEAKDHFRALGHTLFSSGIVVYVQPNMREDGTFITEKLTLDTTVPKGAASDMIIVIVKEGARLDITSVLGGGEFGSLFARTFIVLAEADGVVRVTHKSTLASGAMVMQSAKSIIARNASLVLRELFSGDALISSLTEQLLIGDGARALILQGLIGVGHAHYDIDVSVRHMADDTRARIHTAGTVDDAARVLYRGLIAINEGVHKVVGNEEAQFLMLSPKAKIDAIPSLDIAANDVSCTHKLGISHIHEGDTFYPKLRGLSDSESRRLFFEGHFAAVFAGEENQDIMSEIREKLSSANPS